jgi:hypothetical protein
MSSGFGVKTGEKLNSYLTNTPNYELRTPYLFLFDFDPIRVSFKFLSLFG